MTNEIEREIIKVIKDLMIIKLADIGVKQKDIRTIVGGDIWRVNKINSEIIKAKKRMTKKLAEKC